MEKYLDHATIPHRHSNLAPFHSPIIDLTCACASITGCDSHDCATVTRVARTAWWDAARMCGTIHSFEAGGDIEGAHVKEMSKKLS